MIKCFNGNTVSNKDITKAKKGLGEIIFSLCVMVQIQCMKDIEFKGDTEEVNYSESYFKFFYSIGIVMTCLTDSNFRTLDIYKELSKYITKPFVLISENTSDGYLH